MYRKEVAGRTSDPFRAALEVIDRRDARSGVDQKDGLSELARRGIMTYAERKILLLRPRGFCAGVVRAIDVVKIALDLYGKPIYVRKEIVHNRAQDGFGIGVLTYSTAARPPVVMQGLPGDRTGFLW